MRKTYWHNSVAFGSYGMEEQMIKAYIALGSNLNNPDMQLRVALNALAGIVQTRIVTVSSFYQTTPMGPQDQPDFINAVALLETALEPEDLLDCLQQIETAQGRVRGEIQFGPRTLDLDILLYGNQIIQTKHLIIPHYGIKERIFVLQPLVEIAPDLKLPSGECIVELLNELL